ncbi:diadenylate cyclase CdaA [Desulfurispira natronophila]|uniref:Diadenylate cyclase n=1 Tax=Desulfurispira natronophila TaxID=682562 RepID=A0A7W8DH87_9BACT|nr:diadenylate cyclase CdaA [Desulfurispira natronophila]MBB5022306.1 diadenylate cyclase [Desulfurispira natronophila]
MSELIFNFTWRDAIDILLVWIIIYKLLTFLRGTTAVQVFSGILLILGVSFAAQVAELNTIYWLVKNIAGYLVLALIILFHPEIRKFLVSIGQNDVFRVFAKTDQKQLEAIEEVVRACVNLASRKMGALIVLERESNLQNYADVTVVLDAITSKELLITIFQPSTPIHDGAVLIRNNRIHAAGCFLTVSMNPDIDKELGTRHRAAIGVTEQTDCVAVVVSEETGAISVAVGGRIIRKLDSNTLKKVLKNIFSPRIKGGRK